MGNRTDELQELLAPAVADLGLELLGVEWHPAAEHSLLRLYIDVAPGGDGVEEGPRGVTVEDCEAVSREVEAVLDINDPIPGRYQLEVSSPGIDRPLFSAEQFARHVGETVKLQLRLPIEGRRRFQGRIHTVDVEEQRIVLDVEEGELILSHDSIEKARIVPDLVALGLAPQPKRGPRNNH
ncbi:MAG: ribosome maturation factor RimP [Rhodanobacteraceae bacterium]|nr:ribosome maturation factor RimP [Xanthomonadales bacterium]MCP5478602.1 ribosome maturation factor RimP [Rhodanobacteraceae bacterium]HPF74058.1 ribosome maturation factor RimP [Xanthomonadaceae bacterium]HRY00271.1 ribosome maturation factor RimP [Xanthomonadaceae bacterium]